MAEATLQGVGRQWQCSKGWTLMSLRSTKLTVRVSQKLQENISYADEVVRKKNAEVAAKTANID